MISVGATLFDKAAQVKTRRSEIDAPAYFQSAAAMASEWSCIWRVIIA